MAINPTQSDPNDKVVREPGTPTPISDPTPEQSTAPSDADMGEPARE